MPRTSFADIPCSVARAADIVGERWTPLILRDVAIGISRFDALQRNLGVSRKVLSERLERLADHGVIQRVAYQDNPPRYDYRLTEKGADLAAVLLAMQAWGDKWAAGPDGPPLIWRHAGCGRQTTPTLCCDHCREPLRPGEIIPELGPGFDHETSGCETAPAIARLHALMTR